MACICIKQTIRINNLEVRLGWFILFEDLVKEGEAERGNLPALGRVLVGTRTELQKHAVLQYKGLLIFHSRISIFE